MSATISQRLANIPGTLMNNPLIKLLRVIRGCTYQSSAGDIMWAYEPVSDVWLYEYPGSESSVRKSGEEGITDQDNIEDQVYNELLPATQRKPRRIIKGYQR